MPSNRSSDPRAAEGQGLAAVAAVIARAPRKTLAAVLGIPVAAAAALFVMVPAEESGRKVEATVQGDGSVRTRHLAGHQYLKAYRDIAGVWTICDGDTKGVTARTVETQEGCDRRLEAQLIAHAEPLVRCVPGLRGRPDQAVASVSLAYNIGTAGFCRSSIARHFNAGRWREGCNGFLAWNKARVDGELRPVAGLSVRRQRERAICLRGV
jgi:lysozyme